ncbi:BTB/POZ domain-containing protein [Heterostelium album PN500]|uniref:BTB/POZ domain-containing protein n=1 Tax=Heterostelium pallidum (strain ATCC 26659 / Pp 5 / PN500) TaxID=670386 RepID=D3AVL2_HETP5|nr:BTB/POZ domain-containing protein [Heterostelium album PN500]EFA86335.1 BTB/POZ domain-containing protein [Heterostelium album PN500]|eukprot:XP_020438440.1 BTB/POZ domain-containing protein [Heterostelium album PN500]
MDIMKFPLDLDNLNLGNSDKQASSSPVVSATASQHLQNPTSLSLSSSSPSNSDQQYSSNNDSSLTDSSAVTSSSFHFIQPSFQKNNTHDLTFLLPPPSPSTSSSSSSSNDNVIVLNYHNKNSSNNIENDNGEAELNNEVLEGFLFDENLSICSELNNLYIDQAVCNSTYFLQLNRVSKLSKDLLIRILKSNDVYLKEIDIFKSAIEWIRYNIKDAFIGRIGDGSGETSSENGICNDDNNNNSNNNNNNNNEFDFDYDNSNNINNSKVNRELAEIFNLIRFPTMDYEDLITLVEPMQIVPDRLLLEAFRFLSRPELYPKDINSLRNHRLQARNKQNPPPTPGVDVYNFLCPDHQCCSSVSWTINNFSSIKTQKHVSNTFEIIGLKWKMWAYPAGEAKHSDSFSVYLEAVRVKEKESYDFLRNTTFFFALVNHKNKTLSKHYPSSPNVLFNYEKSVWGNGLIELKLLYDPTLGYLDNDTVCIQLHILECIAIEG